MSKKESNEPHGIACNCDRCIGLRRYPQPSLCDWCGTVHAGDAANCPTESETMPSQDFPEDTDKDVCIFWYVHNAVKSITEGVKNNMLPKPDSEPSRGKRGGNAMTYLDSTMLSKQPKEAKILAVRFDAEGRFGARVIVKLSFDGGIVYWGVNIKKNPNYRSLIAAFGEDENDWPNQRIKLWLEKDDFSEQMFVHVAAADEPEKKRR
jgi:hypothetical protein